MRAKTLWESFRFAFQGFVYSFKTQRNFRVHCLASVILGILIAILDFELYQILFLLSAAFFVLISELFNTAIEKTIDLYTAEYHPLAKIAKNCAAAAVLMSALYAIVVGVLVMVPRLLELVGR
ncbi:MAG: diacylglycerol kinase family protein [Eubacteriales bacterium]|nr:diacylglycerol kinase family protein [Eubacteriales bacterium]